MRILVAYASKYGATEGIAERLGDRLGERGHEVDVRSCMGIDDASGYDAYVIGSAVYAFNWRRGARKFVERHASELSTHPVWLFASGPLGTDVVDKDGKDVLKEAEPKQFAEYEALLGARGKKVFRGAYDHEQMRGADRMIVWMPALRELLPDGDFREWDEIDAWADAIADELGAPAAPVESSMT